MGAAREKDQADFDLERFIDMFDEALTSKDERVVNALRSLMMMVILTKPESHNPMADRNAGPLRRLYDDVHHLHRRIENAEHHIEESRRRYPQQEKEYPDPWQSIQKDIYTLEAARNVARGLNNSAVGAVGAGKYINQPINKGK